MDFHTLLIIVIIILIIGLMQIIVSRTIAVIDKKYAKENLIVGNVSYFRLDAKLNYKKSKDLSEVMNDIIRINKISISKSQSYIETDFLLFESLDRMDYIMSKIYYPHSCKFIYGISGTDDMASKSNLYRILKDSYPEKILNTIVPKTYILNNEDSMSQFRREKAGHVYIAKKNIQRQAGVILFTDNVERKFSKDYVVIQRVLQNPFLIDGKKINLRVYMLIIINETTIEFYVYNDGFLYYTADNFEKYTTDPRKVITAGFDIDRNIYNKNPLTIHDLTMHIGNNKSETLNASIIKLFKLIKNAFSSTLFANNVAIPGTKFLIYGCDVAPDENLDVTLMEINKGPDLSYKDDRDKKVKQRMMKDAFDLVGITNFRHDKSITNSVIDNKINIITNFIKI
jgi:hypothetical protein